LGRTREFDSEDALDKAGALFWRLGYDVVSIQQLEAATGLGRGSLYNTFGDKERLFLASLDRYAATYGSAALMNLDDPDVGEGIRRMLDAIIARMENPKNPPGCLLTNTSLTYGSHSPRIDADVAGRMAAIEDQLRTAINRARDEGQIPADSDPVQLARFYAAVTHSLAVMHRAQGDVGALRDVAAVAVRAWPRVEPSAERRTPAVN
jgi:TetR/AcrR family transcriptional repressor of nem operon